MIVRTEAIVLRSIDYGETSRIVTLYTRNTGKMTVMAKGARSPRSRFGSSLQPMSYIQIVYYDKPGRSLQMLKESSHVYPFNRIRADLNKISAGLRIVELMNSLMHDEEENIPVFNLLLSVLMRLNEIHHREVNLMLFFQLRMASLLGFAPQIDKKRLLDVTEEGGVLSLDNGSIHSLPHAPFGKQASRTGLRAFAILTKSDLDTIVRLSMSESVENEVTALAEAYMKHHFSEMYPSRAGRVLAQVLGGPPDEVKVSNEQSFD